MNEGAGWRPSPGARARRACALFEMARELRVARVIEVPSGASPDNLDPELFPVGSARECVESFVERLSPKVVVMVCDTLRRRGRVRETSGYIGHRFGVPVVVLYPQSD